MTETSTMTLTDFLLARIAEDEIAALRATCAEWWAEGAWFDSDGYPMPIVGHGATGADWVARTARRDGADAAHIARHDPTRVLTECKAKRKIVNGWGPLYNLPPQDDEYARQAVTTAGHVFRCLALPYADHPDYRDEWRP